MRDIQVSICFDKRAPAWAAPVQDLYRAPIAKAAFADRIAVATIGLMEHHGADDGYLSQPFTLAAAMAAVTKRIRLLLGAVVLPLHDPVMLAEQITITDIISNGRIRVVFGAGYVASEFASFGRSLRDRAKLMDIGLDTIIRALHGERFEAGGRPVFVRPLPVQAPEEIIMVGGGVAASARRAARFDVGFGPQNGALIALYLEECAKRNRAPRRYWQHNPAMPLSIHLCEDPDESWAGIEQHAVYVISRYAKWAEQEGNDSNSPFKGLTAPEILRQSGLFAASTPSSC
jgi:alkanesulfonate monooxygenase SsuD/methylene tetrahydromethanopterin reductase-like flavin-dependent oxidoreductase (luciferase family)